MASVAFLISSPVPLTQDSQEHHFHSIATFLGTHQTPSPTAHWPQVPFQKFFSFLIPVNCFTCVKHLPVPLLAPLNDQKVAPACHTVVTQLLWKEGGKELLLQSSFDFSMANEVKGDLSSPPSLSWRSQNILAFIWFDVQKNRGRGKNPHNSSLASSCF